MRNLSAEKDPLYTITVDKSIYSLGVFPYATLKDLIINKKAKLAITSTQNGARYVSATAACLKIRDYDQKYTEKALMDGDTVLARFDSEKSIFLQEVNNSSGKKHFRINSYIQKCQEDYREEFVQTIKITLLE